MSDEQRALDRRSALACFEGDYPEPTVYHRRIDRIADALATARREALEQSAVLRLLADPRCAGIAFFTLARQKRSRTPSASRVKSQRGNSHASDSILPELACAQALAWLEANEKP